MFGRFFKNKEDGGKGGPPGHRTPGQGAGPGGNGAAVEEPVGGGFFNLPPPVAKPYGAPTVGQGLPGSAVGYPPPPAYGNTQESNSTTGPPVGGMDMFGGMALKNPPAVVASGNSTGGGGYQPHQYGGYGGGAPPAAMPPQQAPSSLFSGLDVAPSGAGGLPAASQEETAAPGAPMMMGNHYGERRQSARSSGSFNYLDVAATKSSDSLGASGISRTSGTSSTGTATSRSSSKLVKKKKKKTFRPGFGRQLSDESAAALQRGDLREDEVLQKHREGRLPSDRSDSSRSSRSVAGPTDLAHLLPPVKSGSVLQGLTVHSGAAPSGGGVLAGLTVYSTSSPSPAKASLSSESETGGNGVLSGLDLHPSGKDSMDTPVEEASVPAVVEPPAPVVPAAPPTPEERLFNTLRDFHASAVSFREMTVKQNEEENRILDRKAQLAIQLTQYEMDLRDIEAQQHHACEVEDFEKADALNATINSVRHCITLTESDVRKVDSELVAFVKAKEKAFANQLKSTRGTLRELEKFREDQETERVDVRNEYNQYEADQTEQLQFEAERIDTEMHHVAVSLENVAAEKSEIESTIEDQCRSEFAVREQLLVEKESVEEEVRELERKLKLKLERVQEIQSSIDNAQRDIDTVRGRYSRQLKRIADREEGILKTQGEVEADGEQLTSQRQEFHQRMEQYSEDIATIGKRIGTVKKEMRAAALLANVLEVQETRREQSIIRKKQQTAELSSLNDAAAVAEQSFTMLTNQHEELEKSLSIHRNAIASAESMIPRLEQEKKASAAQRNFKEAARISKDIKGLEKDRATAEEMVEVVEMELQDLKERIDKREVEFEEKKKELKEMEQHLELATLQEMWKEAKHLRTALRKLERCKSEGVAADDGIDFRSSAMLLVQAEYDACMLQVETLEKKYDVSDPAKDEEDEDEDEDEDESIDGEVHEVEQRVDTRLSSVGRLDVEGSDVDVEAMGDSSSMLEEIASQLTDLEAQIEKATVNEEYELAARLDEKIEALKRRQQVIEASIVQDSTADVEEETTENPVEDAVGESNEEEYYVEEDAEEMEYGHEEMLSPVSGVQSQEELTHKLETIQLRVVMLEKQIELATENEDYDTAAVYDEELLSLREEEQSIHSQLQGGAVADSGVFGGVGMKSDEAVAVVQEATEVEAPVNAAVDSTLGGLGGSSLFGGLQMSSGPTVAQEAPISAEPDTEGEDASAQEAEEAETISSSPTKVEIDSPTSFSSTVMKDSFFGNPQAASVAAPSASGSLFGGLQMSSSFHVSTPSVSSPEKESPAGSLSSRGEASDSAAAADNIEESSVVAPPAASDMFGGLQLSSSAVKASTVEATTSDDMFGGLQLSSSAVAVESAVEAAPASEPSNDMFGGLQLSSSAVAAPEEMDVELSTSVDEAAASMSSVKSGGDTRMSIQELSEHSENGSTTEVLGDDDASSHADTAATTSVAMSSETTSSETTTTTTSTTVTTHTKVSEEEADTGFEDAQQEAAQP